MIAFESTHARRQRGAVGVFFLILVAIALFIALVIHGGGDSDEPECLALGEACSSADACCSGNCSDSGSCCAALGETAGSADQCCSDQIDGERCCAGHLQAADSREQCCEGLFYWGTQAQCGRTQCPPGCVWVPPGLTEGTPGYCRCNGEEVPTLPTCSCEPCQLGGCDCPDAGGDLYAGAAYNCAWGNCWATTQVFWAPDEATARECTRYWTGTRGGDIYYNVELFDHPMEAYAFCRIVCE